MIIFDTTTTKLILSLAAPVTTNELVFTSSYVDIVQTVMGLSAAGSESGLSNGATPVDLLSAPPISNSRQLKYASVYNNDTVSATVTIQLDDNGTIRTILQVPLGAGGTLEYVDGEGWRISFSGEALPGTLVQVHTGLLVGGNLSIGSDTAKFYIQAGAGFIVNNYTDPADPDISEVVWAAFDEVTVTDLASNDRTYVSIDVNGAIIQQPSPWTHGELRDLIVLGLLIHPSHTSLQATTMFPVTSYDQGLQFVDLTEAIGKINEAGNVISANGANLNIDRTAGEIFSLGSNYGTTPASRQNPSVVPSASENALTFRYRYQDGSGGITEDSDTIAIAPNLYDDGSGTPAAVASNRWTTQRFWCFPDGIVRVMYGQTIYNSKAIAEAAIFGEVFNADPNLLTNAVLRGWLIVKGNASDLSDGGQAKFIEADKFGHTPSGGVSSSTTTLQQAYNNSVNPEILTDGTLGAFSLKRGSAADTDDVLEVLNGSDVQVFCVTGEGDVSALEGNFGGNLTIAKTGGPQIIQTNLGSGANLGTVRSVVLGSGTYSLEVLTDAGVSAGNILTATRAGTVVGTISLGNSTDDPDINIYGDLIVSTAGKGMDFSAAGGSKFDYYEEGNWTPTNTNLNTFTACTFTKKGDDVTVRGVVTFTAGGQSGVMGGLPFTSNAGYAGGGVVSFQNENANVYAITVTANSTNFQFISGNTVKSFGASTQVEFILTYKAA